MKKSKDYKENYYGCSDFDKEPATGELKEIAKEFERQTCLVRELGYLTPSDRPGMNSARFMLEGIRTNGKLKRSGSLSNLYKASKGYLNGLKQLEEAIEERRERVEELHTLLNNYEICPDCGGEQGELLGPNYWTDCYICDGQGMIRRKRNESST